MQRTFSRGQISKGLVLFQFLLFSVVCIAWARLEGEYLKIYNIFFLLYFLTSLHFSILLLLFSSVDFCTRNGNARERCKCTVTGLGLQNEKENALGSKNRFKGNRKWGNFNVSKRCKHTGNNA